MLTDRVSIFGLGYVGLTFGVCLASRGFKVVGVDVDEDKVTIIDKGKAPFHEPEIDELLLKVLKKGTFHATTDYRKAVLNSDVSFICVGTPSLSNGSANLEYIKSASRMIGEALRNKISWHLVVVRSTVPPGTCSSVVKPIIERFSGKSARKGFGLCMNPEFLKEGSAVNDIFNPNRIVIGEFDKRSGDFLEELYRKFYAGSMPPLIRTNMINAELIKYASNAFLATKISFINTIANICEHLPSADVNIIAKAIGLDPRISPRFLRAGVGFGGSCFPKDLKALIAKARDLGYDAELLKAAYNVNVTQPYRAVELAKRLIGRLNGKRIAVLGLAFKPNTDDMREAPSIKIINKLLKEGARVVVYDPVAMDNAKRIFRSSVEYAKNLEGCLRGTDCAIIVTEWDEFKRLRPEDFIRLMRSPAVVDGRRIYDPEEFKHKVKFAAIGLGI